LAPYISIQGVTYLSYGLHISANKQSNDGSKYLLTYNFSESFVCNSNIPSKVHNCAQMPITTRPFAQWNPILAHLQHSNFKSKKSLTLFWAQPEHFWEYRIAQWFLTGGYTSPRGVNHFQGGGSHCALCNMERFWMGKCSVQTLRQCQFYAATS